MLIAPSLRVCLEASCVTPLLIHLGSFLTMAADVAKHACRRLATIEGAVISIDTFRADVAKAAIAAGAAIINDVTAGRADPHMFLTVRCPPRVSCLALDRCVNMMCWC